MADDRQTKLIYLGRDGQFHSYLADGFYLLDDELHAFFGHPEMTSIETLFDYEGDVFHPRAVLAGASLRQETLRFSSAVGGRPDGLYVRGAGPKLGQDVAIGFDYTITLRPSEAGLELIDEGGSVLAGRWADTHARWTGPDGRGVGHWLAVSQFSFPPLIAGPPPPEPPGPRSRLSPLAAPPSERLTAGAPRGMIRP